MSITKTRETLAKSCPENEQELRIELAAAYRLVNYYGMTETIHSHISVRIQEEPAIFLINPYGLLFDEICASNLVRVDVNGNKIDATDADVNPPGFTIHSAIHLGCPNAHAIAHTHTVSGMAVAAMEEGLLPLNQASMEFYNRVAYHDYEGISLDLDERERIVASLGAKKSLIMRNHGLLTVGRTVAEAFYYMYNLNKACEIQVNVLGTGTQPIIPPPDICEHTACQFEEPTFHKQEVAKVWAANCRLLDRLDPSYRN
ncbi:MULTISPECIES: class II aldolase/adducin family protein [unclassified Okeania]|uniref:class II aldolase/adducin family protein n=1 Tax=unclassified Okeania TaxID=2634635 RepID=UPI0013BCD2D1|nr:MULTISPECIES: class II aldolase/adducin family protein [unclassified Okeania]NES79806.1 class II aldolase/adducin family protein [Okeania sp. SIO1H4]NET23495.1 class II aldolase/adducin family protein [Okeania sp. SIO1H5]NET97305.1 class II aldolase/adducin family protein [Okeania sp. SIO1H2]